MGTNPSEFTGDDCPVEYVSWDDAQEFIQKLNDSEPGAGYCLPTDAQWEFACRAGSSTTYCFGNGTDHLDRYAWYVDNAEDQTHPVGRKQPNDWGLYDMHGNVWEWCSDWYDAIYSSDSVTDPEGALNGSHRVIRGGSWSERSNYARCATRESEKPDRRHGNIGFRLSMNNGGRYAAVISNLKEYCQKKKENSQKKTHSSQKTSAVNPFDKDSNSCDSSHSRVEDHKLKSENVRKSKSDNGPLHGDKILTQLGMEFVYIGPGKFQMGSDEDDDLETILHEVILTRGYYMQITPVTQFQWERIMGNNPSHFKNLDPNCPVETVSWNEVQVFVERLNAMDTDASYRLPSEAEWEYACRAGSTGDWCLVEITFSAILKKPNYDWPILRGVNTIPKVPIQLAEKHPILGACTICMEMCGSGAKIGTQIISMILH
jgi:formylglycine-generating enzyme required for sulfatase activity